jgi:hypothetical protein
MTESQNTLTDTLKKCAITTSLIDIPVRTAVTIALGLPPLYPVVSAAVEFSGCVAKELLPACNEHKMICTGAHGAIAYSARAAVLGQDVPARALVGIGNKVAYALASPEGVNPILIETFEATTIAIVKEEPLTDIFEETFLGTKVGMGVSFCFNLFAKPALQYLNSQDTVESNTTQTIVGATEGVDEL